MTSERINPAELARPSGFSHAVAATGRMVFLAGQTGVDRDGNVAGGGVVPQFERALTSLLTALGAAGGLPSDLVSLTIYLTDMADYQAHARDVGAVWRLNTETDVLRAISCPSSRAAGSRSSGATTRLTRPPARASSASKTRPV